jgi:hypothetical protein
VRSEAVVSIIPGGNPHKRSTEEWEAEQNFVYEPLSKADGCFYCCMDLGAYPIVQWSGAAEIDIFLHPVCAGRFAGHLAKDSALAQVMR